MTDWKTIVDQYGQLVWATAYRLVGNHADAADCFQDAFLQAVTLARCEPVRDWTALLRHLATLRALDLLRTRCRDRSRAEPLADPAAVLSRDAGPVEEAEANELAERLRLALAELPADQAAVFCLSCLDKLSYREIAERLQLTTNSVGTLLYRARARLREILIPVETNSTGED